MSKISKVDKISKYVLICRNRKYWEEHVLDFNLLLVLFVFPLLFYYVLFTNNNIFCVSRLKWDLTLYYESHNLLLLSFSLCHSKWLLTTNLHIKVMLSLSFFLSSSLSLSLNLWSRLCLYSMNYVLKSNVKQQKTKDVIKS